MLVALKTQQLTFNVTANTIATNTTALRIRKNAANGVVSLAIAAGGTGQGCSTANYDNFAVNDELDFSLATPNTSGTITVSSLSTMAQIKVLRPTPMARGNAGMMNPTSRYGMFGAG
jgi:hypothetical protein